MSRLVTSTTVVAVVFDVPIIRWDSSSRYTHVTLLLLEDYFVMGFSAFRSQSDLMNVLCPPCPFDESFDSGSVSSG